MFLLLTCLNAELKTLTSNQYGAPALQQVPQDLIL